MPKDIKPSVVGLSTVERAIGLPQEQWADYTEWFDAKVAKRRDGEPMPVYVPFKWREEAKS